MFFNRKQAHVKPALQQDQYSTKISRNAYRTVLYLLVAGLVGAEPASAAFPGKNGKIAFYSGSDSGNFSAIYTVNSDGSGQQQLPNGSSPPAWSPNGTKIAFTMNNAVYVMNADGTNPTAITSSAAGTREPAWSPKGTQIVFSKFNAARTNYELYVVNTDGTGLRQLTNNTGKQAQDDSPDWSPDGTKVVFSRSNGCCVDDSEIFVINVDGSGLQQLTSNTAYDYSPDWSPDGTKIAFHSVVSDGDIYVMNANGTNQKRLTSGAFTDQHPAWSPDATKIVFERNREIYIMNADGTSPMALPNPAPYGDERNPDWQPLP